MELSYRTVAQTGTGEFTERRSRFIGAVCPVSSEPEALEFVNNRRKEFWNAKHNVYAYILRCGQIRRYSDDGEPQGTAGIPVLDVLQKEGLTDCAVAVTRYFGGILLGTGGLVRAYSHGAKLAVEAGGIVEMRLCDRAAIACEYPLYGRIAALIPEAGGMIETTRYTDRVEVDFVLPRGQLPRLQAQLTELSSGSLTIHMIGEKYISFSIAK